MPSVRRKPDGQESIDLLNSTPTASQSSCSVLSGFWSTSLASTTGGTAFVRVRTKSKISACCTKPRSSSAGSSRFFSYSSKPFAIYLGQQMVCHLFLKKNPLSVRDRAGEVRHNFPPIGFAGRDCFVRAGMFYARHLKVIGVKRLIENDSVVPIAPRAHHGRRNISRTRPHGDTDGLSHPQKFSRYRRIDQRK